MTFLRESAQHKVCNWEGVKAVIHQECLSLLVSKAVNEVTLQPEMHKVIHRVAHLTCIKCTAAVCVSQVMHILQGSLHHATLVRLLCRSPPTVIHRDLFAVEKVALKPKLTSWQKSFPGMCTDRHPVMQSQPHKHSAIASTGFRAISLNTCGPACIQTWGSPVIHYMGFSSG